MITELLLQQQDPFHTAIQERLELEQLELERLASAESNRLWIERELEAQHKFQAERALAEAEQRKIDEELEAEVRQRMKVKDEKRRIEEEIRMSHKLRLEAIRNYISDLEAPLPESLTGTVETNTGKEECQFFKKTGVCRFGDRCSRNHIKCKLSSILVIPNFFRAESLLRNDQLTDADEIIQNSLELNRDYNEFFEDVAAELEQFGGIRNFAVCCNKDRHMIGNAYVEYFVVR